MRHNQADNVYSRVNLTNFPFRQEHKQILSHRSKQDQARLLLYVKRICCPHCSLANNKKKCFKGTVAREFFSIIEKVLRMCRIGFFLYFYNVSLNWRWIFKCGGHRIITNFCTEPPFGSWFACESETFGSWRFLNIFACYTVGTLLTTVVSDSDDKFASEAVWSENWHIVRTRNQPVSETDVNTQTVAQG